MPSKADLDRALAAADKGFKAWRKVSAYRALQDHAQGRRHPAQPRRRDRTIMTHGAGQAAGRGQGARPWPAPTSSTGSPRRRAAPMAASSRRAPRASTSSSSRSRSARSPPSRRGTSRSTRWCARSRRALAAGCSIIIKGPEETPGSLRRQLIQAFVDAGVPAGVINLVYGVPSEISEYLIPHPIIRKMSFTGSTAVGKQLAALAGAHMKRVDHGTGRPCAGHRVRGCRSRARGRRSWPPTSSAMPARSASRRPASWCRRRSTTRSSTSSPPPPRP